MGRVCKECKSPEVPCECEPGGFVEEDDLSHYFNATARLSRELAAAEAERDALRQEVERLRGDLQASMLDNQRINRRCSDRYRSAWEGRYEKAKAKHDALQSEVEQLRVKLTDVDYDHRDRIATLEVALREVDAIVRRHWDCFCVEQGPECPGCRVHIAIDAALGPQQGKGEP